MVTRKILVLVAGSSLLLLAGCATKNYAKQQVQPVVNKTNELDELTAKNTRDTRDLDTRVTSGINDAKAQATAADQKAMAAGKQADEANTLATGAAIGANNLTQTVANLDNYRPVKESSVQFAFNKADLTKKSKAMLDELAAEIPNARHFIITVTGGADSVGSKEVNYAISQRRADAVIQYLASTANVPANKFYVVGLGKDQPVAPNTTGEGRAQNRRVDVRLMTNVVEPNGPASSAAAAPQQR